MAKHWKKLAAERTRRANGGGRRDALSRGSPLFGMILPGIWHDLKHRLYAIDIQLSLQPFRTNAASTDKV